MSNAVPEAEVLMDDLLARPHCTADDLGKPLPPAEHAVSVCLPLWQDNVGYEEADPQVVEKMRCGYPRFFLHPLVVRLFEECAERFAGADECCFAFPSRRVAEGCAEFIARQTGQASRVEAVGKLGIYAVCLPRAAAAAAKSYWQHTGEIVSSRMAAAVLEGATASTTAAPAICAKRQLRERIAAAAECGPDDVYLFPTGMAAVYTAFRVFQKLRPGRRSVQFGFPYVDILKIQQHFAKRECGTGSASATWESSARSKNSLAMPVAPSKNSLAMPVAPSDAASGVALFPKGTEEELDEVERLAAAEEILGLFCEFPGNPLLRSPDLRRLSELADAHQFPLLVDDTLGAMINVNALPAADVTATSLTKFFSGQGDVMGGALVLNADKPFYGPLKSLLEQEYEDLFYADDAVVLERNSRDFRERVERINRTAEQLCDFLRRHPAVAHVYYPNYETPENYRTYQRPGGGFGGLFSVMLHDAARNAPRFFDALRISKGPNLGTNFSLCCPYTLLAHYNELDFAEQCGISRYLVRVSVGLEEADWLIARFAEALDGLT